MIKFSKLTWVMLSAFFVSLVLILFNKLAPVLVYPALAMLLVACILLCINVYISKTKQDKEAEIVKEELLMEITMTEEGEEYVMKNNPSSKKYRKMLRRERLNRLMPFIFCVIVTLLVAFLLVRLIFKF